MEAELSLCETRIRLNRARVSWLLYDLANSVYPTLVTTFIFAPYFVKVVAVNETAGTSQWGLAMSVSGGVSALLAPYTGAIADAAGGRRKPCLALSTLICVIFVAGLYFIRPEPAYVLKALVLVVVSQVAFELCNVFYNAMLTDVAPSHLLGRISGWGWATGYVGGLMALIIALFGFIKADPPPFGLDPSSNEPIRACMLLTAAWFALFSIPLFVYCHDGSARISMNSAMRRGMTNLAQGFSVLAKHPLIVRFLIVRMIYNDGIIALFAFSGVYAAGTFAMDLSEIIFLGIATNITAALGAFIFAWIDDKAGSRTTISLSLSVLILCRIGALLTQDKMVFWIFALLIGFFVGPVQSASRSFMVRIAPDAFRTQMLSLYALSGKVTAFVAPALLAWATAFFNSQRAGMSVILMILAIGLYLLRRFVSAVAV